MVPVKFASIDETSLVDLIGEGPIENVSKVNIGRVIGP